MIKDGLLSALQTTEKFFNKTIEVLSTQDALYRPQDELYTVTAHIDHVADSISWFIDGAFKHDGGFELDFDRMIAASAAQTDFTAAKEKLQQAFKDAKSTIEAQSDETLLSSLPEGPIMAGAPRLAVVNGIIDHTAHHRGSLAVYCRLLGKIPAMPYS
ncbi:MAG: DinB family protein [Planctomycetes bacterium]|nr:DinB family protein [Planctomycetota bacterium]